MATFERLLIEDKSAWNEPKNAYYKCWEDEKTVVKILREFNLCMEDFLKFREITREYILNTII